MYRPCILWLLLLIAPSAQAQTGASNLSNPVVMVLVLGALALAPFMLIMLTSFVKIAVVLSILRNAIGTQQVPPNQVITGLAFVLTIFVMTPVAGQMYAAAGNVGASAAIFSEGSVRSIVNSADTAKEPLRAWLERHCHDRDRILFMELGSRLDRQNDPAAQPLGRSEFRVLIPAFVTSELKEAFQIGFLVFVPFLIIDMVVANVLLAMGMSMLSPVVISLPFKLLLFVMMDGWYLIARGLVESYL
ncbi:MAG: type III secretion system export apparatus subunit SctR [Bryobacterales bacterium]|jgi:type III secretion protein R|nr:type III secretion system export apparatus subunit SctR [Bryobacterales bacterium]